MASSKVRSIESLQRFHDGLLRLSSDWDNAMQEVRMMVHRAEEYFSQERPRHWRQQIQLAERDLSEAKDNLAQKRAAVRVQDRPAATEAAQRVQKAEQRLRTCEAKFREARAWAIEIQKQCDDVLGPLADVAEHCEVLLPSAAGELRTLIEHLKDYTND